MKITIAMIFLLLVFGCSSDDAETAVETGYVSYTLNGKNIEHTQANSFMATSEEIILSFADGYATSIGMSLETNGKENISFDKSNVAERGVSIVYKGSETTVQGYSVNSIFLEIPELNKKGSYTISIDAIKDKRVSGKFQFVAYSDDNKDSVVVKNGIFKNIPGL